MLLFDYRVLGWLLFGNLLSLMNLRRAKLISVTRFVRLEGGN
jgi:hypothetical protein